MLTIAPPPVPHQGHDRARHEEVTGQVHVDHAAPDVLGVLLDAREGAEDARVVVERVDAAVGRKGRADDLLDVLVHRGVAHHRHGVAAVRCDEGDGLGGPGFVDVGDHDLGALRREERRGGASHSRPRAGDDSGLAVEFAHQNASTPLRRSNWLGSTRS